MEFIQSMFSVLEEKYDSMKFWIRYLIKSVENLYENVVIFGKTQENVIENTKLPFNTIKIN